VGDVQAARARTETPFLATVQPALDGRYVLLRVIGRGGMGTVFEAENVALGRRFAVKILEPEHAGDRRILSRFLREARVAARIGHPHIVDVHDFGVAEGLPYLVMDLLEGESLASRLRSGPISPYAAIDLVEPVLSALEAAHAAGIVHRDLKPENVFLTQRGGRDHVKVIDFGIASLVEGGAGVSRLTRQGSVLGTPSYMSPEQARGAAIDARSDVYSVGVMLYEMLSGRLPYTEDHPALILAAIATRDPLRLTEIAPHLPRALAEIADRAMAREPGRRFQTAAELRHALVTLRGLKLLDRVPSKSSDRATSMPTRRDLPPARRAAGWIALAGVAAATVASAIAALSF